MRNSLAACLLTALVAIQATPGHAYTDEELIDGFNRTVFGSEYGGFGWQSWLVKKFDGPVRVYIDDRAGGGRRGDVRDFLRSLPRRIDGLTLSVVESAEEANYRIFIVDRIAYRSVVTGEVYGRPSSSFAPGRCLVRVVSNRSGIERSDAVIVADEGDFLFNRCMVEEILQGLGPVNDDASLADSVFNDSSTHATFTRFDRAILNMLYHPSIRPGMTRAEARRVLPEVAAEVNARLD